MDNTPEQETSEQYPVQEVVGRREIMEEMTSETRREQAAWARYRQISSSQYEQANQERIADGKIKIVRFGETQHLITLVASIKVDPETGRAVSGHENRPDAESMIDTERAFADYLSTTAPEQRMVIYEGDERIFANRNEAISKATDSGLAQYLATQEQVPIVSGEPTEVETVAAMEQLGVSRGELLALYVARGLETQLSGDEADFLAGYIYHQAALLGTEGFHEYSEAEKQAIVAEGRLSEVKAELTSKVSELLPTINNLYREILGQDLFIIENDSVIINPDFSQDKIHEIVFDKLGWSGNCRLNEVGRLSMEMRDRTIFHRILEAYNSGKNPFVVYGGSHIVTLEPALRAYFEFSNS